MSHSILPHRLHILNLCENTHNLWTIMHTLMIMVVKLRIILKNSWQGSLNIIIPEQTFLSISFWLSLRFSSEYFLRISSILNSTSFLGWRSLCSSVLLNLPMYKISYIAFFNHNLKFSLWQSILLLPHLTIASKSKFQKPHHH